MKPSLPPFVFLPVRSDTFVGWEENVRFICFPYFGLSVSWLFYASSFPVRCYQSRLVDLTPSLRYYCIIRRIVSYFAYPDSLESGTLSPPNNNTIEQKTH